VGGGFDYGTNGLSHYGLEDIAVMRAQPGIHVIAPADAQQTRTALLRAWNLPGPVYLRIGKDDRLVVPV
jgi:transketolase